MSIFTPEFDSEREKTRQQAREHPPKPIAAQRGTRLAWRLTPPGFTRSRLIGCGSVALAMAAGIAAYLWWRGEMNWWLAIAAAVIAAGGLFVLSPSRPMPIIEVSQTSVRRGEALPIHVRHAGPATFDSYALTVACFEILQVYVRSDYRQIYDEEEDEKYEEIERHEERVNSVLKQTLFDERLEIGAGQTFDRTATWVVPNDAEPTGRSERHEFRWLIRLEGTRNGATVMSRGYPLNVLAT